jgi:hypothetical protein
MREIICRGKRTDGGGWVEGSLIQEPHRTRIFTAKDDRSSSLHEVFPETVGQYINFNDKNGRKIFQGDLCMAGGEETKSIREIYEGNEFGHIMIKCVDKKKKESYFFAEMFRSEDIEKVGNVYDNKELIK